MEIIINKDIRKVKTKDLGMFSFKEAGFLALAVGLGAGIFFLEKKVLGFEKINYYLMIIPMAIPLIFGFFKPFGLTFWQFCKTYIQDWKKQVQPGCICFFYADNQNKKRFGYYIGIPGSYYCHEYL